MNSTNHMNSEQLAREQLRKLYDSIKDTLQDPMGFYPVDIEKILKQNGWVIHEVDGLGAFEDGQTPFGKCDFKNHQVTIDLNLSKRLKRYTLAHELGHIVLHGHTCNTLYRRSKRPSMADRSAPTITQRARREELEADQFAANILMPAKAVRAHFFSLFQRNSIRIINTPERDINNELRGLCNFGDKENKSLCDFFEISLDAMIVRLKRLGLVACG